MKDRVEKIIAELATTRSERRSHVFALQVDGAEANSVKLTGKVLEPADLEAVLARVPDVRIDASAVQVLRRQPPITRYIATNLTNLHREPSWISELMSQFTNGAAVEILEEKDRWCFVRLPDGYLGWAYKPYQTETAPLPPTHLVSSPIGLVYAEPAVADQPATRLSISQPVHVVETRNNFARVQFASTMLPSGWIATSDLRPIASLPLRPDQAARQMIADARSLKGVYYMWGGTTAFGIDCSGLCQLVHRLTGYTIPRDADMQFAAGKSVEPPYQPGDLMFFGGEPAAYAPRKVTHVALSLGGWKIIHSSRSNNGVYEDDIQAVDHLRESFCGARTFIR